MKKHVELRAEGKWGIIVSQAELPSSEAPHWQRAGHVVGGERSPTGRGKPGSGAAGNWRLIHSEDNRRSQRILSMGSGWQKQGKGLRDS